MSELPLSANLKEQLVAYLDGELDDDGMREVEALLSTDPRAREALRQLETAWDLLDSLPRAEVDESFTESTIEIVAVSLEKEMEREEAARPRRERRNWGLAAAAVLAASVLGFAAVISLSDDPNDQLLRDLPLLERLDQYRHVDDLEFLRELHTANLLRDVQPQPEEPTSLADRRMLVEQLTPAEKQALQEKQERLAGLPEEEQQKLRSLHDDLQKDPQAAELRGLMAAYHEWRLKLSPLQRSNLASAATPERMEQVRTLRTEEIRRTADRAEPADMEAIAAWLEKQLYQRMKPERKAAVDRLQPEDRRGAIMLWSMTPRPGPSPQPEITSETIADLRQSLSPEGKAKLDAFETDDERRRALGGWYGWISQAMRDSVRKYFEDLLAGVPADELVTYAAELPQKDQEYLLKLSSEHRDHRLRLMYVLEHRKHRLMDEGRGLKPEHLGWLQWGRGSSRWSGFRDREVFRGDGPPLPFASPPDSSRPRRN
jgi:hypothetical protein